MRNPKKVKIIILGLKKSDEYDYFGDTQAFIKKENPQDFPLNQIGQSQGILLSRLENYVQIKTKYLLKEIKGKFMFSFYNHNTKTFYHMNKLLQDGSNFIFLNLEFCDDQKPLLVRLSFRYQLYQLQYDLEENKKKISKLEQNIQELYIKLQNESQLLNQINEKINRTKDQDQSKKQKYEIAILYSHPVQQDYNPVKFNEEILQFVNLMKNLNKQISYYITQATKHNLQKVLRQNPKIIYISCHGSLNHDQYETYLEYEKEFKDQSDFCVDQVKETDVQQIVNQLLFNRALIFLSCCHSGKMAEIFHQQGYPTVAIDRFLKLEEKAANSYFSCFYEKLLQEKFTFGKCHEEARKQVQKDLGNEDFQDCLSHGHTQLCKELFKRGEQVLENYLIDFQRLEPQPIDFQKERSEKSCCKLQQDQLLHKWDDQCEIKKNISEFLQEQKGQFQDQKNIFFQRLDELATKNDGLLNICCCELAKIFFFNHDDFKGYLKKPQLEFEHVSSKKFKLFGDENCKIFNFIQDGYQTYTNKVQWQEEYVVKIDTSTDILKKLLNIFQEKEPSNIIYVEISDNSKTGDINILKFLKQVTNYFRHRYIEQSKLTDIIIEDIEIEDIENNNQKYQYEEQELIKYIFIIKKKINQEQWEKNKEFLLNLKHTVIVPYYDFDQVHDPKGIYLIYKELEEKLQEQEIIKN